MVKKALLFLVFSLAFSAFGSTYFYTGIRGKYTATTGQDTALTLRITYVGFFGKKYDSLKLKGGFIENRYLTFSDNFTADHITLELINSKFVVLQSVNIGSSLGTFLCAGHRFSTPFNNKYCTDLSSQSAGVFCAQLEFQFVTDNAMDNLGVYNGHFSDPRSIYCEFNAGNQESPLYLQAPCYFGNFRSNAVVTWFESENGSTDWKPIDTGVRFYPAKYKSGMGKFYNQKRWYKAVLDTNRVRNNIPNYTSGIIGPIRFYLGASLDSIITTQAKNCNEQPRVTLFFDTTSISGTKRPPRVWVFYKASDTATEKRWFLDSMNQSPFELYGKKLYAESGRPAPPDRLLLPAGKYRVMYDFTAWNGYDCKLQYDTFEIKNSSLSPFTVLPTIQPVLCYGGNTGALKFNSNTDSILVSLDSLLFYDAAHVFNNLTAKNYTYFVTNQKGCTYSSRITISEPPAFATALPRDTVLCKGQTVFVNAQHPNSKTYTWFLNNSKLSEKDTLTLKSAGEYALVFEDINACKETQRMEIVYDSLVAVHDFLLASEAFITDTVYAVNTSIPAPRWWKWEFSDQKIRAFQKSTFTLGTLYPDTGIYVVKLRARYNQCTYSLEKTIPILGTAVSNKSDPNLGYKGPLIQSFTIDPNPNDGYNFTIKVQLRDTANSVIYKIDPVSGDIVGDVDYRNKKYYESKAFTDMYATPGVFYLKLIAGTESKTIKVVVVK